MGQSNPVDDALAAGIAALAASMAKAAPVDLVTIADRMAALAKELESRRLARAGANVVTLASRREKR